MLSTPIEIIGILIIYQSLAFIISILNTKQVKPFFTKILMGIFITIIVHFGYMLLVNYGFIRAGYLGPFFGFLYGPLYYSYTRSLILASGDLKRIAVHFIPAVIMLVVILLTGSAIESVISIVGLFISIHLMVYLIFSIKLIYSYRNQLHNTTSSFYKISLSWLEWIIYLQLTIIAVTLLESYFQTMINTNFLILIIYAFTLVLIHSFYFLGLKQVRLFNGLSEESASKGPSGEYTIPEDVFEESLEKLVSIMESDKPYLEYDLTLQDLADKVSISTRNLSHVINKHFNKSYYNFINHYRLELAKQELRQSDKPVKEVMYGSGFANKATFNSIFKKSTGLTPSQFRKINKSWS